MPNPANWYNDNAPEGMTDIMPFWAVVLLTFTLVVMAGAAVYVYVVYDRSPEPAAIIECTMVDEENYRCEYYS